MIDRKVALLTKEIKANSKMKSTRNVMTKKMT